MIDKAILDEVLPVPELETLKEEKIAELKEISIHAPRAGSDSNILCFCKLKAQYILNQLF